MIINNKKGSLGITIVMLVFCLLMSVCTSYHKILQTETNIHKQANNIDRAMDAAFSGVNYAVSVIQSHKTTIFKQKNGQIPSNSVTLSNKWLCLDKNMTFKSYYDETDNYPPYRFKVACSTRNNDIIHIKSIGEYIQYDGANKTGSYTAQIIAECKFNDSNRTIKIKKYRKMTVNENKLSDFTNGYTEY